MIEYDINLEYGVTRENVLGVQAVLPTGEIIRDGGAIVKRSSGYDLTQLVIGSEGSLAIVTEATLKLRPRASVRSTLLAPFADLDAVTEAVPKILAAAVNGPAVGIAVTLLMHCDLVHCTSNATFWAPFTRLALVPELCSSVTFRETMGLSKTNELLLLSREIDAQTAVDWGISSRVVHDCDLSGDPFHEGSLSSRMCREIDERLLSLPKGSQTASYFVKMLRGKSRSHLQDVCREELLKLDERFACGDVQEAARGLRIGSQARQARSKL